jgi:hypothetical protein
MEVNIMTVVVLGYNIVQSCRCLTFRRDMLLQSTSLWRHITEYRSINHNQTLKNPYDLCGAFYVSENILLGFKLFRMGTAMHSGVCQLRSRNLCPGTCIAIIIFNILH